MNTLSNERLKEIVEYQPGGENYATRAEWMVMARELLAYREAQGKAEYFINRIDTVDAWGSYAELRAYEDDLDAEKSKADHGGFVFRLYAAPQLPAVPDGWALVPKEMTDGIGEAISYEAGCCGGIALDIYEAMLAAAPKPE